MKKVFISFSSIEIDKATHVCDLLESNGFSCFIANRDLLPGQEYAQQLIENMEAAGVVVLLLSKTSNSSPHVLREIEFAVSHKIPILVYKLEDIELSKSMEYFLMTHQWIADTEHKEQLLLDGVSAILKGTPVAHSVQRGNSASVALPENTSESTAGITDGNRKQKSKQNLIAAILIVILLAIIAALTVSLIRVTTKIKTIESSSTVSDTPEPEVEIPPVPEYKIGDTILFGTYYDAPIEWRVLRENEDGTLTLISKYLLTMKAYDSPEGGEYNRYGGVDYGTYENHVVTDESLLLLIRGNNDWSKCNLRTWLNSEDEVVKYEDAPPTYKAIGANYYNTEPGFLHSFTAEEKAAIVTVTNKSTANTFSENAVDGYITSEDKVYLLSSEELNWFDEAGISMYAVPTEECKAHDEYIKSYELFTQSYHTETYYYWLRDSSNEVINKVYITTTENVSNKTYLADIVGSSYGVRPVITIDPTKR